MTTNTAQWAPGSALWWVVACAAVLVTACSGGGSRAPTEIEVLSGRVLDGALGSVTVCVDVNGNARCDDGEPKTLTSKDGSYSLGADKGWIAPLIAEVSAGVSVDADAPDGKVQASFRMASPRPQYSTDITPYTTLVYLSGESNFSVAEDLVRDVLGLPARFSLALDPGSPPTTLVRRVARFVVQALQATDATLNWLAPGALARLCDALPAELTTLPTLAITTKDGAPILSKEEYVDATYVLGHPAAATPSVMLAGKIRGRGHSTWGWPKNPYKVQFANDAAYGAIPDVLGMPKNRNWALLADYFDRSLMRNKLAFALANSAVFRDGMKWNPSGLHVEVALNGDYVGVYLLTEDIRIDPARLAIKKMSSKAAVNDVDGGYIFEADVRLDCYNEGDLNLQYVSPLLGVKFCIDTPDEEDITQNQLAYAKDLLGGVERDIVAGVLSRLNTVSFADWYLESELFKNLDSPFLTSVFLWKDTDAAANALDRLLNLGPLWDFDLSAGNTDDHVGMWSPDGCWVSKNASSTAGRNWLASMFDRPEFVALVVSRWQEKRPALARFIDASVDTYTWRLQEAQKRNFERWPILGTKLKSHYVWESWEQEVAFLQGFLRQRIAWMDQAFASPESFVRMCK